jgi:hypothetical protein
MRRLLCRALHWAYPNLMLLNDLRWHGVTGSGTTVNASLPFRLSYKTTGAHLDWSMASGDRSFRTNPAGQTTVVAFIGEERNGVFFSSSGDDDNADD